MVRYLSPMASPAPSIPLDMTTDSQRFPSTQVVFAIVVAVSAIILTFLMYFCIRRIWLYRYKYRLSVRGGSKILIVTASL